MPERCYQLFEDSLRTEDTRSTYASALNFFKEYRKAKTYTAMLDGEDSELQDLLIDYIGHLKKLGKSTSTLRVSLSAIRHFYSMNDKTLNWAKILKFIGAPKKTVQDRIPSREEIARILEASDERQKAIMFLLLSGLRIGALPGLNFGDLKKWDEYGLYQVTVYANEPEQYITFLTPEGTAAVDNYLQYRSRKGETLGPSSPLFREQFENATANKPKRLSKATIEYLVRIAAENAGIRQRSDNKWKRHDMMTAHAFRKWFNTTLNAANLNYVLKERLMGHSVGLEGSYLRATEKDLLEAYAKAINNLTINDENRLKLQVKKIQEEKDELVKSLVARLEALEADKAALKRGYETRAVVTENLEKLQGPLVSRSSKKKR